MFVSMSRTIGCSMSLLAPAKRGTGPTSIIWCTAGVSGMCAPAIRPTLGLHTPHQSAGAKRVDDADPGRVEAAEDDLLVDVGHELLHLVGRDERHGLDAPRLR